CFVTRLRSHNSTLFPYTTLFRSMLANIDPLVAGAGGAIALAVAAVVWAFRVSAATRHQALHWSDKLAEMEARLEKSDSVLSAHPDRKSTRLNSSHVKISYAVFCL